MPAIATWSVRVLLLAAMSAVADPPYLPSVGPPALRFANPPVERPVLTVQLPPLVTIEPRPAPHDSQATPVVPQTIIDVVPTIPGAPVTANEPPSGLPVRMEPVVSNAVEVVRLDTENLTPQMFMQFFSGRPGTNASGVSIIAPLPFIPPALPAPSSSASFQTTPPAKP